MQRVFAGSDGRGRDGCADGTRSGGGTQFAPGQLDILLAIPLRTEKRCVLSKRKRLAPDPAFRTLTAKRSWRMAASDYTVRVNQKGRHDRIAPTRLCRRKSRRNVLHTTGASVRASFNVNHVDVSASHERRLSALACPRLTAPGPAAGVLARTASRRPTGGTPAERILRPRAKISKRILFRSDERCSEGYVPCLPADWC